jgi:hypothetical protein
MTSFVVVATGNPAAMQGAVTAAYPDNNIRLNDTAWLVSDAGTSRDVSVKLRIINDPPTPNSPRPGPGPTGTGVVLAIAGYFGHANPAIWEFLRAKSG